MNISNRSIRLPGQHCTTLVGDVYGPSSAPCVLLLHGGGQTRHAWRATAQKLGEAGWHAIAIDLPGHGDTDRIENGDYSVLTIAGEIACVVRALQRPITLVGASLGGLAAMGSLLLDPPLLFDALVLVDVAPRIELRGVERIMHFMTAYPDGFASLNEAALHIARYRGRPFYGSREGLRKNLRRAPSGRWVWHWDPRLLEPHNHEERSDVSLYERALRTWVGPTLLIRGMQSDVVSSDGARELLRILPSARWIDLADAGHMIMGDTNDIFINEIIIFLHEVMPPA